MAKGQEDDECEYREQERIFREECEEDFDKDPDLRNLETKWEFKDIYDAYLTFADIEARIGSKNYPAWTTVSDGMKIDIVKSARARREHLKRAGERQRRKRPKRDPPPITEQDA
jgi:hypothetical protein